MALEAERHPTSARPVARLWVRRWPDPVVESRGVDARSSYVERFWLPVLGPSATLLLRALADELDRHPGGYRLDLAEAAAGLGMGTALGPRAPLARALGRLRRFGALRPVTGGVLLRTRLALLSRRQLAGLTPGRRAEHERGLARHRPAGCPGAAASATGASPPGPEGSAQVVGTSERNSSNVRTPKAVPPLVR